MQMGAVPFYILFKLKKLLFGLTYKVMIVFLWD